MERFLRIGGLAAAVLCRDCIVPRLGFDEGGFRCCLCIRHLGRVGVVGQFDPTAPHLGEHDLVVDVLDLLSRFGQQRRQLLAVAAP